ncbi:hypothetical protein BKA61DRAFT_274472 [Leptodontidium sp. MPI-SDFR-AT-0119]|nr:hypothetical protein BKA61DRAFT_274472 [Leptodontidium sp. MPI-SDFR-AT-0119]
MLRRHLSVLRTGSQRLTLTTDAKLGNTVPAALHGADLPEYFGPGIMPNLGPEFIRVFMTIFGNFAMQDNPSISALIAAGNSSTALSSTSQSILDWPAYTNGRPYQMNLNQTGGKEYSAVGIMFDETPLNVTNYRNPGLRNNLTMVDAFSWEGGRGVGCDFWRSVGSIVPE